MVLLLSQEQRGFSLPLVKEPRRVQTHRKMEEPESRRDEEHQFHMQRYRDQLWPGGEEYCLRDRRKEVSKESECVSTRDFMFSVKVPSSGSNLLI